MRNSVMGVLTKTDRPWRRTLNGFLQLKVYSFHEGKSKKELTEEEPIGRN